MLLSYNYYRPRAKQYTYIANTTPDTPYIPLNLVKEHLRLDPADTSQDSYLTFIVSAAYNYAQSYTHRTFYNVNYTTFRDSFATNFFSLRRSPLSTLSYIKYLKNGVLVTLDPSQYYVTDESMYSRILKPQGVIVWPNDNDKVQQCVHINFTAGYGTVFEDLPKDLVMAMLQHTIKLYESRGDCDGDACSKMLPAAAKEIYDIYKIFDATGEEDSGYNYDNYPYNWI